MNGNEFILLCSNLDWAPEDMIRAYSFRFKIEVSFKALKHLVGSFCYHFWCQKMPRLSKKKNFDPLSVLHLEQAMIRPGSSHCLYLRSKAPTKPCDHLAPFGYTHVMKPSKIFSRANHSEAVISPPMRRGE